MLINVHLLPASVTCPTAQNLNEQKGLYRVSRDDDLDVASAQFFVNSSLAPVFLRKRRLKSVADVLKGFVTLVLGGMLCVVDGMQYIVREHVGLCVLLSLGYAVSP